MSHSSTEGEGSSVQRGRKRSTATRREKLGASAHEGTNKTATTSTRDRPNSHKSAARNSGEPNQSEAAFQSVLLEDIDQGDMSFQFRFTKRASANLRESIELVGQLEPVDLLGPKPYRILQGHRRVAAAKELGKKAVQAIVHVGLRSSEAWAVAFAKNVVRRNLSALERANTIHLGLQNGETKTHLTNLLGISERQVNRDLELLNFLAHIQQIFDGKIVTTAHARVLVQFGITNAKKWRTRIEEDKLTAKALKKLLRKTKGTSRGGRPREYVAWEDGDVLRVYPFRIAKNAPPDHRSAAIHALESAARWLREAATDENQNLT